MNDSSSSSSRSSSEEEESISYDEEVSSPAASVDWNQEVSYQELSESWVSQINPINEDCFCSPLRILRLFSMCFWPTNPQSKHNENDCFVAVDHSQALFDRIDNSPHRSYTPTLERVEEHQVQLPNVFTPLVEKMAFKRLFHRDMGTVHSPTPRYTPISASSITSYMGGSTKYGTHTSNTGIASSNTLHRRADLSAGFFTLETMEAIYSDKDASASSTPGSDSTNSEGRKADETKCPAYQTPARPRINSEIFRKEMGEVTCEKLANSEDDVSPIESEEEFAFSLLHKSSFGSSEVHKRLVYDEVQHSTELRASVTRPFSEIGKAIESIQEIFRFSGKATATIAPQTKRRRQSSYLRQSISFIKALRRNNCTGKVLIQGWIAFRQNQNLSWRDVSLCTRRSDFRYILLLDKMPTLHIFSSKPKQKRGEPKANLLDSCLRIDLKDVEIGISLASKEWGHEVILVESESNKFLCSMLPVAMKNEVFLDKHRARLAKKDVLGEVFQKPNSSGKVAFQDEKANNTNAIVDQNDAARHLLFVLSAAITFPPPREFAG
jgi:hypothetical protein